MAPIKLQEVIKFSSEDIKFPASNLLSGSKWMNNKLDHSGKASFDILFDSPSYIHYIDLGYYNIAQIEVQVALSTWPVYHEPVTILPSVTLQTFQDNRAGLNKSGCRMFNFNEHLVQDIACQKWDKIRVVLQQPHSRNKQMGIDFIRFGTQNNQKVLNKKATSVNDDSTSLSWKDSPIGKIMSSINTNSTPLTDQLTNKICRLSDFSNNSNCYGRTARMLMSSKLAALKAKDGKRMHPRVTGVKSASPTNKATDAIGARFRHKKADKNEKLLKPLTSLTTNPSTSNTQHPLYKSNKGTHKFSASQLSNTISSNTEEDSTDQSIESIRIFRKGSSANLSSASLLDAPLKKSAHKNYGDLVSSDKRSKSSKSFGTNRAITQKSKLDCSASRRYSKILPKTSSNSPLNAQICKKSDNCDACVEFSQSSKNLNTTAPKPLEPSFAKILPKTSPKESLRKLFSEKIIDSGSSVDFSESYKSCKIDSSEGASGSCKLPENFPETSSKSVTKSIRKQTDSYDCAQASTNVTVPRTTARKPLTAPPTVCVADLAQNARCCSASTPRNDVLRPCHSKISCGSVFPSKLNASATQNSTEIEEDVCIVERCETSKEIVYTDEQIKLLKRAIKKFFNKLDLDAFDPENDRVRDLRKRFEESHSMKLNKDGRSYFREITARFMTVYLDCRKHKIRSSNPVEMIDGAAKRQSSETTISTPTKIPRRSPVVDASTDYQQCPICFGFIDKLLIENHAALCGQLDDLPDLDRRNRSNQHARNIDTVIDCSENSCLTDLQQRHWIQFSKEPKPYHERLNTDEFVGCTLVKCPSCGLKYKSSEIEAHCDDCTEKVNSGCTRMGLYLIEAKKKNASKSRNSSTNSIIVD